MAALIPVKPIKNPTGRFVTRPVGLYSCAARESRVFLRLYQHQEQWLIAYM